MTNGITKSQWAEITPVGIDIRRTPSIEEFEKYMAGVNTAKKSWQWWLAELIDFGLKEWGDQIYQIVPPDISEKTILNVLAVHRNVPKSRRRKTLSFSHHAEVSSLEPEDQDKYLSKAYQKQLSVSELRGIIREEVKKLPPSLNKYQEAIIEILDIARMNGWRVVVDICEKVLNE